MTTPPVYDPASSLAIVEASFQRALRDLMTVAAASGVSQDALISMLKIELPAKEFRLCRRCRKVVERDPN